MTSVPIELSDFPFPLAQEVYRYSANLQPGGQRQVTEAGSWGEAITRVGPDYEEFIAERARLLAADPGKLISVPYLRAAEWDTLLYLMRHLAAEYPADFELAEPAGPAQPESQARWVNRRLGLTQDFVPGDPATLPAGQGPLEFIGRQVVEDLVLLDERENHLWADAGLVTFASGWSFPFVAGMTFQEIHGPVPRANPDGVFARAEAFLLRLQPGEAYRRVNWTFQPGRMLDKSMDSCATWLPEARRVLTDATQAELAENVYLRVELQHLVRLETSGAVLFLIDTRFASLADVARIPAWAARAIAVLEELPRDMADYKGLTDLGPRVIECLRSRLEASGNRGAKVSPETPDPVASWTAGDTDDH